MNFLFWTSALITAYTYIGYGLICWFLLRFRVKRPVGRPEEVALPELTLLIPAYNEADILEAKLANSLALEYPRDKLRLVVVADGSDDGTLSLMPLYPEVLWLYQPERRGKMAAVNRAMRQVDTPLTVMTDANALLSVNALLELAAPFSDPLVGAVAGEKGVISKADDPANAAGEGLYWRYESWLKRQDAALGSVVGAAGELYALRTKLFNPLPDNTILDDFCQTLQIAMQGYRVEYRPQARAWERASADTDEELKRKIRICSGGFQAIGRLAPLLNPLRFGLLSWQYISHRVLRWTLAPLCLLFLLLSNAFLAASGNGLYQLLLGAQLIFYALALLGWYQSRRPGRAQLLTAPFYFLMMNYGVFAGFLRFLKGRQSAVWERARRLEPHS